VPARQGSAKPSQSTAADRPAADQVRPGVGIEREFIDSPGLLILNDGWEIESATPGAQRWLAELPDSDRPASRRPSLVITLAARALRMAQHPHHGGDIAVTRVLIDWTSWL
jgi:hypothetical protein